MEVEKEETDTNPNPSSGINPSGANPSPGTSEPVTTDKPETVPAAEPKKVFNFSKILIPLGIVLGVGVILFLIFKVILPKITGKQEIITINYSGMWEEKNVLDGIIADFEAKNPNIKINYTKQDKDNYRTILLSRLAKDEGPDIYRIHQTWLPNFLEYLAPVPAQTAQTLELETDFFDVYKNDLKSGGNFVAIPLMYDGLSLYYNKDLITAAGVTLPKSWWDLKEAAKKLTVKDETGKIKVAGVAMGLTDNVDHFSDIVGVLGKQNGTDFFKNDQTNNGSLLDALKFYSQFGTGADRVWDETMPNSTSAFGSGKLAFYFAPSWRAFELNERYPNLKYEIIPVPQLQTLESQNRNEPIGEGSLTNIHWASYWVEGVNSKSKNQKEAWQFLEYLASKEGLEKMYLTASQVRAFGEIYPRKSMAAKISENKLLKPFATVANQAESWYLCSRTWDDKGINDEMSQYFADAINGMIKNSFDSEKLMVSLRNGIEQVRVKYQLK